jgi:LmbE family N-acetylglucosaminyl deacetylase
MIVPLVSEAEWLAALSDLPLWAAPNGPTLVLAPHPDDETLAAGGFIAAQRSRGTEVVVVAVTDGEMAYADASGTGDAELGELRSREQTEALARLGVCGDMIVRLRLPDSGVAEREREIVERVLPQVTAETHLLAPWPGDFHPDHEACGRAAEEIARRSGARLTFWFFWTWHRGTLALLKDLGLRKWPLTEEQLRAKAEALCCHRSQLERPGEEPILPENLLAPARRSFEVFLPA